MRFTTLIANLQTPTKEASAMCSTQIRLYAGCRHPIERCRLYCVPHLADVAAGLAGRDDACMYAGPEQAASPFADEVELFGDEATLCPACERAARRRKRKAEDREGGAAWPKQVRREGG